ncbi:MAG TPA: ferrochelatase [Actinomycetes bacterium]|nr:ferrochelatase [Actinomycetes bacterium]
MSEALLLVSFGGPEGPADVVPFLQRVTRGRDIPPERLAVVGEHYFHFGGVSPINEQNRALRTAVELALAAAGRDLPVYWGNRNWDPLLADALGAMAADGVEHAYAFFTSAYSSYSGCRQYRENLAEAAAAVPGAPQVDRIGPYFNHAGFVTPFVDSAFDALGRLPDDVRDSARLVFTTHSLPQTQAETSGTTGGAYVAQHREVAALVADAVSQRTGVSYGWDLAFQSRSGPPSQPWLEPDVGDHLTSLHAAGVPGAVIVPIGFVSDHMEVVWDLDTQAQERADALGLPVARAATPGTDPRFVAMVVELVGERLDAVPVGRRPRLGDFGPSPDRCEAACCPNPRGPRPALAQGPPDEAGRSR